MITVYKAKEIMPYYPTALDIETAPNGDLLDIGFLWTDENNKQVYKTFRSWSGFTSYIIRQLKDYGHNTDVKYRLTHIYAHNGNGFDWLSYLSYLIKDKAIKTYNVMMSEQMIIGIMITFHTGHKVWLCDSMRLMPYALSKVAEMLNKDHKKIYVGEYIKKMDIFRDIDAKAYYEYLKEDCYALSEALYRFWCIIHDNEGFIGHLPLTLPSLSLRIFRKNLPYEISTPWNERVRTFTRRSYAGGRVECYKPGEYDNMRVYDVNSMYPAMMARENVPISSQGAWTWTYDANSCGFYEIRYTQTDMSVPPLLRDETSKEFQYTGSGVYYTKEINKLLEIGGYFELVIGYEFSEYAPLFSDFVNKYYGIRLKAQQDGNKALDFIAKILLNSLYGKFGQNDVLRHIEPATNEKIAEYTDKGMKVRVDGDFMIIEEEQRAEHEFVAIASIITATARIELYEHIVRAGDAYVYADTDSVHISSGELPVTTGLGGLKLEKEGKGVYVGRKLYAIGDKVTAKGIGRALKAGLVTSETLTLLIDPNERITIQFESMPTLREVLHGIKPCTTLVRTRTIRRTG